MHFLFLGSPSLLLWTMWMNACVSISPLLFLKATVICQEMPLFPNHSPWDSRYSRGRNFIAQSWMSKTFVSLRQSVTSLRALSWFTTRSWCAFQLSIAVTASWNTWRASSFSFSDSNGLFKIAAWISDSTVFNSSHHSLRRSWVWSQLPLKLESMGSFRAYLLQWSGTRKLVTLTCL